jgi:putative SOS response-associated peptidase YedK
MCTNYRPSSRDVIKEQCGTDVGFDYPVETYKGYIAPIVRLHEGQRVVEPASFGLIPPWCKSAIDAKKLSSGTMNARSETVGEKPSFKNAWRKSHYCLIPMHCFYEPCYESGKAIRYSVKMASGADFCAAGIWSWWVDPESKQGSASFSMLTLNADNHSVLKRLHKPEDEKRSLFVVPENEYETWLNATPDEARAMLMLLPPKSYVLEAAPRPTTRVSVNNGIVGLTADQ